MDPVMGEYHENLTMQEAYELYEKIPPECINGVKGIGFRTYQNLMDEKIAVRAESYDQVYLAARFRVTVPRGYGKD